MVKIISFVGHERAGKNFIGDAVFKNLSIRGFKVKQFANADALKNMACAMLDISLKDLEYKKETNEKFFFNGELYSMREFLITLSENWVKPVFGQTVWGDVFSKFIRDNQDLDYIIKTDDRYDADIAPNINTKYVAVIRDGVGGIFNTPYFDMVNKLLSTADFTIKNDVDVSGFEFMKYINTMTQTIERQFLDSAS